MWLISLRGILQQIKFDDMFSAEKTLSSVLSKYLGLRSQVANCRLTLRSFEIEALYFGCIKR